MTVCKFFLQGNCRKGRACKFEHIRPGPDGAGLGGVGASGAPPSSAMATAGSTVKDLVAVILSDLAERPLMWHFSTYGLSNPNSSIPSEDLKPPLGTAELSMEELRLQAYLEARASSSATISNYQQVVKNMQERAEWETKSMIPKLEQIVQEFLNRRAGGLSYGGQHQPHQPPQYPPAVPPQNIPQNISQSQFQALPQFPAQPAAQFPQQPFPVPSQHQYQQPVAPQLTTSATQFFMPDTLIFGEIPEMPPE